MGLTLYDPAPTPINEPLRDRAVELSGALELRDDAVLQQIVQRAQRQFNTAMAAISIVHADWQYLVAASGLPTGAYSRRTSFCGHIVAAQGTSLCVPDAQKDARFAGNPSVTDGWGIRFYAGVALRDAGNLVLGALCVFDPRPRDVCPRTIVHQLSALAEDAQRRLLDHGMHRGVGPGDQAVLSAA